MVDQVKSGQKPGAPYRLLGTYRLLLASLVMVQHAGVLLPAWLSGQLGPLEIGGMAVFCFFAVSGFVIVEAACAFYPDRPVSFLSNRLLRLVPTYLVALLISAVVLRFAAAAFVPAINESPVTPERYALKTVLLNSLALFPIWRSLQSHFGVPEILEQGWALRVEFLFYMAVAFGLAASRFLRLRLDLVFSALGAGLVLTLGVAWSHVGGTTLENVPYFVFGVALYFFWLSPRKRLVAGAFLFASGVQIALHLLSRPAVFGVGAFARDPVGQAALLTVLMSVFVALCRFDLSRLPWGRVVGKIDRAFGDITYPLYLTHWAVVLAAKTWLHHESWLTVALTFASAYALAATISRFVEKPVARLRTLLRGRSVEAPARATDSRPAAV